MADEKAKQAETKKVEEKDVMPDGSKMPKPLNEPAQRKVTRPETTQTPTGRYPSPPAADADEDVPEGHSARTIVLSDVQWAAIDRMVARGKTTPGKWLRQFLAPYLR